MKWLLGKARLLRLRHERTMRDRARKLAARQAAAHQSLGSRALIPTIGKSQFLYHP